MTKFDKKIDKVDKCDSSIIATTFKMRLLVISTLAGVAALAAVCAAAADEDDGEGFSLQFDGWPSGENLGLSLRDFNVQLRFQLARRCKI